MPNFINVSIVNRLRHGYNASTIMPVQEFLSTKNNSTQYKNLKILKIRQFLRTEIQISYYNCYYRYNQYLLLYSIPVQLLLYQLDIFRSAHEARCSKRKKKIFQTPPTHLYTLATSPTYRTRISSLAI